MSIFNRVPLHPLLFSAYPILALLAHNLDQIKPAAAWRLLLFIVVGIIVLYLLLVLVFRNRHMVAVICTLFAILFFSYGHVYEYLNQLNMPLAAIARHRYLLPIWLAISVIGLWLIGRNRRQIHSTTPMLNAMGVIAITLPLIQILFFQIQTQQALKEKLESNNHLSSITDFEVETQPDIYYIILDAYTRQDILEENYCLDNTSFISSLRDMGFYVADCSQSNYAQTELSMAATFNMDYLENLGDSFTAGNNDRSGLWPLLRHGKVRQMLESVGYNVIAFETGYYWIQWEDADSYLSLPKSASISSLFREGGLNSFEAMLIRTSVFRVILDTNAVTDFLDSLLPDLEYHEKVVRERTLFVLDRLQPDNVPAIKGPKFIYAHIIAPHPPYVFGPKGEFAEHGEEFTYNDQITYINKRILQVVDGIIENSQSQPIIIIQGDHGLKDTPNERVAILNAYYLPEGGVENLYPSISPVNSFRLVFDHYLGTEFGLLDDISYYSTYELPYNYEIVPNFCRTELSK